MFLSDNKLIRIGMFYDGGYFSHVSNYYNYNHTRRARLSINGIHQFVRKKISELENVDLRYTQVVDAHYFRGRYSAKEAENMNKLMTDRMFDDILMRSGVVTHYLPLTNRGEKGIDVWFALEALELAIYKRFNVLVLIACDSDYVHLVRKLNTLGTRVMVLGWDFEYVNSDNEKQTTTTSQVLLEEVTYPILMHQLIDDKTNKSDHWVNGLFVEKVNYEFHPHMMHREPYKLTQNEILQGKVKVLKDGYGFIYSEIMGKDFFFYWNEVINMDFNQLIIGQQAEFKVGKNDKGDCAIEIMITN